MESFSIPKYSLHFCINLLFMCTDVELVCHEKTTFLQTCYLFSQFGLVLYATYCILCSMLKKLLAMLLAYARLCQLSREWLGATILRCMYKEYVIVTKDMNVHTMYIVQKHFVLTHLYAHWFFYNYKHKNFVLQVC